MALKLGTNSALQGVLAGNTLPINTGNTVTINGSTTSWGNGSISIPNVYYYPGNANKNHLLKEYLSVSVPRHLYRNSYNGLSWLNISADIKDPDPEEQYVVTATQVELLKFIEQIAVKYKTAVPEAKDLEFMWKVFAAESKQQQDEKV